MFCFFKLFVLSSYFLSWCFLSCTRSHFGSCSCCSSAGSHTAFQHVFGSTVNSFWNFNFHDTGVVGPFIEVEWSLYTRHSDQIAYVLLITIFRSHEAKWSGCYCILVCLLCHCSMLIISQKVEIWVIQSSFGILTLWNIFIAKLTVFIRRVIKDSWSLSTCIWSLIIRKYWNSR